jgi:hypothetical protein
MPVDTCKRKVQDGHKPYAHRVGLPKVHKDAPKTSAITPSKKGCSNLTLHDWLTIVAYHDANQPISQQEVVKYFSQWPEGVLIFNQSSLSRHLSKKGREEDQARLASNPTALSGKRPRVVTRPDVEMALVLWVKHMEEKGDQCWCQRWLGLRRHLTYLTMNV